MVFSYDQYESLGYLTGISSRLLSNRLAATFKAAGIDMTSEQWGAVIVLLNGGAITQGQLAEQLCLEKSSVSRLLNGLERKGWIIRTRDPQDSRHKLVTPTLKVMETAERCAQIARDVIKKAQQGTTKAEQTACQSFLLQVITNLNG